MFAWTERNCSLHLIPITAGQTQNVPLFKCIIFTLFHLPGIAAATMFMPETENELSESQLKVAFDGDAVLFSDESEVIVKKHGLDTFFQHEKEFENKPLAQVEHLSRSV